MTNLTQASRQWAERPADERFWTLEDLHERAMRYKSEAKTATVNLSSLKVVGYDDSNLALEGKEGKAALLGHYAFGQIARRIGAPADYLRTLPTDLVTQAVNLGLQKVEDKMASLLFNENGGLRMRAITSDVYERIWNSDITKRLLDLPATGWRVPPARPTSGEGARRATEADCLAHRMEGLGIQPGDMIGPAGLYVS